jgi:hypothetical protein
MAVDYSLKDLRLPTVSNVQEQLAVVDLSYNLIGTVNHKSKSKGSYYTAITKKSDLWHCYDGDLVSGISISRGSGGSSPALFFPHAEKRVERLQTYEQRKMGRTTDGPQHHSAELQYWQRRVMVGG